ncbi:MAG: matrixin family metalloprotease [Planctomycetia bacterium]|nr:matrixin family metalloprotease [Planctomycetia bacterium]
MSQFLRVLFCFWVVAGAPRSAQAEFVVVANRSPQTVVFKLANEPVAGSEAREFKLASGDLMPIALTGPMQLSFGAADRPRSYRLVPNGMYYFGESRGGQLDLQQIGFSGQDAARQVSLVPQRMSSAFDDTPTRSPVVIPVKILFDEDQGTPIAAWERRIRSRFDEASRVFEKHCFVRFKIVAIESWHSDDAITGLDELLSEFERTVDPPPARLAIGFTGQYQARQQYLHLGGTRGPLHTHLLIREWVNHNSEAECLEVLIHELGHFLGAVHSPESNSVMRKMLGDRQAREVKFRIGFDPLNTLAMCLLSSELRARPLVRLADLQPTTQMELRKLYTELAGALPTDPAAVRYLRLLNPIGQIPPGPICH